MISTGNNPKLLFLLSVKCTDIKNNGGIRAYQLPDSTNLDSQLCFN